MSVILATTLGDIVIDLDEGDEAVRLNFIKLCKIKAYNYTLFFNVIRDYIAQAGDPLGTGEGGSSIWGHLSGGRAGGSRTFRTQPRGRHCRGAVSMAMVKDHCASQFIITLKDDKSLDGKHVVFAHVVEGLEVLDQINEAFVDEESRPLVDIRILHTIILDDPFPDPEGLDRLVPAVSPEPTREQLADARLGTDVNDTLDEETKARRAREQEARAHALTLEMIGDLPFAEVAPPENVLFVCKLNPVTTSEDLDLIFSRFGKIKQCEIIKDKVTGDSLQYAFIEFEQREAAERAYFKMDSVLIDDRRIKVDFSQSVSKLRKDLGLAKDGSGRPGRDGRQRSYSARSASPPARSREMSMVFDLAEKDREYRRRERPQERYRAEGRTRHPYPPRRERDYEYERRRGREESPRRGGAYEGSRYRR